MSYHTFHFSSQLVADILVLLCHRLIHSGRPLCKLCCLWSVSPIWQFAMLAYVLLHVSCHANHNLFFLYKSEQSLTTIISCYGYTVEFFWNCFYFYPAGWLRVLCCRFLDQLVMFTWKRLNSTGSLCLLSFAFVNLSKDQYWAPNRQFLCMNFNQMINFSYLHLMVYGSTLAIRMQ